MGKKKFGKMLYKRRNTNVQLAYEKTFKAFS